MRSHISPGHFIGAVVGSVLSFRWLPFCTVGLHKTFEYREVWGWRRKCQRCGKTLEVGP